MHIIAAMSGFRNMSSLRLKKKQGSLAYSSSTAAAFSLVTESLGLAHNKVVCSDA